MSESISPPPFTQGGIREWGENEDRNEDEYRDGNASIRTRDFENYTLGRLVKRQKVTMTLNTMNISVCERISSGGYTV